MTAVAEQLSLGSVLDAGGCCYGRPDFGAIPLCSRPATHRAVWRKRDGRTGGIECCRPHADYYASAWASLACRTYPWLGDSAWIEVLG